MSDWFFQDCIEADLSAFLISSIESGEISIDSRDAYDRTPLMVAIEFEKTELVEALLALGGDASGKSSDGETCLSRAIDRGNFELLKRLVDAGADIELASSGFCTPLALAAVRGNITMIDYLLQKGANIEARSEMDETPLIEACFFGHAEAVAFLLGQGADRTAKNAFGQTERGPVFWTGKLMLIYQLVRRVHETHTPPYIHGRI